MAGGAGWVVAVLAFLAVAAGTVGLALLAELLAARRRRRVLARQLERLDTEGLESLAPGAGSLFRGADKPESAWVQQLSARVPQLADVRYALEQADLGWTVQTFLMLSGGLAMALGTGVYLAAGKLLFALPLAALGGFFPKLYVGHKRAKRLRRFEELFPETIDLLGRAIRAGHPFSSGIKMVGEEMAEPVAGEFRRVFEEQRFGLPIEDTLSALADRVPLIDVRIFVTALLIQREVGGNLAEILDNLSSIIRQRFTLQREVRTLTAEGRFSMYVLSVIPIGVGGFIFLSNPDYIGVLFHHPIGHFMVGASIVMQIVGYLWMRKITNIEF